MPRQRRAARDRVTGAATGAAGLVVLAAALLASSGSGDPGAGGAEDRFVAALLAAERATYSVTFDVTRTGPGAEEPAGVAGGTAVVDVNRPPVRVRTAGPSLVVRTPEAALTCSADEPGPASCRAMDRWRAPWTPVESVVAALHAGAYRVEHAPDRLVAGERSRCFGIRRAGRGPEVRPAHPVLGEASEHCFAADGIPVWTEIVRHGATDRRVARTVEREVDAGQLDRLLAGFGVAAPAGAEPDPDRGDG